MRHGKFRWVWPCGSKDILFVQSLVKQYTQRFERGNLQSVPGGSLSPSLLAQGTTEDDHPTKIPLRILRPGLTPNPNGQER